MNAHFGADTEALRAIGSDFARRADLLSDLESQILAVIDSAEWIGEDAEVFRADWSGRVRPGLQECSLEIRHRARRLLQHADEQDHASSPDSFMSSGAAGPGGGNGHGHGDSSRFGYGSGHGSADAGPDGRTDADGGPAAGAEGGPGGGVGTDSSSQGPLAEMGRLAEDFLPSLVGDRSTPFEQLLGNLMDSPAGRADLVSGVADGMIGGLLGGAVGDTIGHLSGGSWGEFLTGLGVGQGLGAVLGQWLPDGGQPGAEGIDPANGSGPGAGSSAGGAFDAEPAAGNPADGGVGFGGSEDGGSAGGGSEGGAAGGGSVGGGSGSGSGGGFDGANAEGDGADAGVETGADGVEDAGIAAAAPIGLQGVVADGESGSYTGDSGARIDGGADAGEEEGGSFLDGLLALLGAAFTPGAVTGAQLGAAAGSEAIGLASIDPSRIS